MSAEIIPLTRKDGTAEFVCVSCGAHVIVWRHDPDDGLNCFACALSKTKKIPPYLLSGERRRDA